MSRFGRCSGSTTKCTGIQTRSVDCPCSAVSTCNPCPEYPWRLHETEDAIATYIMSDVWRPYPAAAESPFPLLRFGASHSARGTPAPIKSPRALIAPSRQSQPTLQCTNFSERFGPVLFISRSKSQGFCTCTTEKAFAHCSNAVRAPVQQPQGHSRDAGMSACVRWASCMWL